MQTAPAAEWIDSQILFLLEVNWAGYTYRFSSFPAVLTHGSISYQFLGGLPDPEISLRLETGTDPEGSAIPFALNFPVDISDRQAAHDLIDGAEAELSYVFRRDGRIVQDYAERFILYRGVVSGPIYGHPDKPTGYIEFSLEDRIEVEDIDLLEAIMGDGGKINSADLSNVAKAAGSPLAHIITDGQIAVDPVHNGKTRPVILGKTGFAYSSLNTMAPRDIKTSPAYLIGRAVIGANLYVYLLIAGHMVDATNIKIYDSEGNSDTGSILAWSDVNDSIFSFVEINFLYGDLKKLWEDEQLEYWATWDTGGGLPSPYRSGPLEGGGDLIMWALGLASTRIDFDNIASFMPSLNRYKFAGYINEPITPMQFLAEHVIQYLPVELSVGPRGLRLIHDLFVTDQFIQPIEEITANASFFRSSAIETRTDLSDICNQINLQYGRSGMLSKYNNNILITPDKRGSRWYESTSDHSFRSFRQFGRRSLEIKCDYVYDYATATQIAQDIVRARSFPRRIIQYTAAPKWGFLWLGDIASITDTGIGLAAVNAQLIAKEWTGASWDLTFQIENDG